MTLSLALLALGFAGPAEAAPEQITYQFRLIEMGGLDWRSAFHDRLATVRVDGPVTVWTAPAAAAQALTDMGLKSEVAPRVTAYNNAPAHINNRRMAPLSPSSGHSIDPDNEAVPREGYAVTLAGRTLEQGVLTRVAIDETRLQAVHTVKCPATAPLACCAEGAACDIEKAQTIEVPEISSGQVTGEWLIPIDGALVVSLGVYTVKDQDGMAAVRERIAIVEATATPANTGATIDHRRTIPGDQQVQASVAFLPRPTPALPSRSLPVARGPSGELVELPPLPSVPPPTFKVDSSEPCATPQATVADFRAMVVEGVKRDASTTRAGFEIATTDAGTEKADPVNGANPSVTRSFSFGTAAGRFSIELRVDAVPSEPTQAR